LVAKEKREKTKFCFIKMMKNNISKGCFFFFTNTSGYSAFTNDIPTIGDKR